jgi:GntR family transcriptional regulator/MocR family aminotransferase
MALPITLPPRGSRLLLRDLHRQLRAAITNGRLRSGARLPSTRTLAATCGVSRNTAVAAYELLLSEGYVSARGGSGTRVAESLPLPPRAAGTLDRPGDDRRLNRVWRGRAASPRMEHGGVPPFSFQIGIPDPQSFPAEVWRRLSGRVLRATPWRQ